MPGGAVGSSKPGMRALELVGALVGVGSGEELSTESIAICCCMEAFISAVVESSDAPEGAVAGAPSACPPSGVSCI